LFDGCRTSRSKIGKLDALEIRYVHVVVEMEVELGHQRKSTQLRDSSNC